MDIIIGIGGTGAKVVEAVLNLAAMGIGPNSLKVGFVDQDGSNGNLNRAGKVFDDYRAARLEWRDPALNKIVGIDECALLKTDVQPIDGKTGVWIPDDTQSATLALMFGSMGQDQFLFDALFETGSDKSKEEQNLDLQEGYRARPHIGAAAMTHKSEQGGDFWNAITDAIKKTAAVKVRIMLAGSIFGGTGAAGFPTIARLIRNRLRDAEVKPEKFEIGGILLQPYFMFPDPKEDQDQNVARATEQFIQAQGALRHYGQLLGARGQRLFDQLYLVGWDPPFEIDSHAKGLAAQCNPALLPEFIAAAAAARFFGSGTSGTSGAPPEQMILRSARQNETIVTWADIPARHDNEASRRDLHREMAQFLRFAVAFKYWIPQVANEENRKRNRGMGWYKAQQLDKIDWNVGSPSTALTRLGTVLDNVLGWSATIEAYARRNPEHRFDLWQVNAQPLCTPVDFAEPTKNPEIIRELSEADFRKFFSTIVQRYAEEDGAPPDTAGLLSELIEKTVQGPHNNMGRFVAALYHFCDIRPLASNV
jgi:hypothetical protein